MNKTTLGVALVTAAIALAPAALAEPVTTTVEPEPAIIMPLEPGPTATIMPLEPGPTATIMPLEPGPTATIMPLEPGPTASIMPLEPERAAPLEGPAVSWDPVLGGLVAHISDHSGVASQCTYKADGYERSFFLPANSTYDLTIVPAIPKFANWDVTVACDNGASTHTSKFF